MENKKLIHKYHDISNGQLNDLSFFFLEKILSARIELKMETGRHELDEEVNVYMAYLLLSLATSNAFLAARPYISAYDADVRTYLAQHPGIRNEYIVYRENADYGLVSESMFLGYEHQGSYYERVLSDRDQGARISTYYQLAASALAHLTCAHAVLANVLSSIAENYGEVATLLRKVAGDYFDMLERLGTGEFYHLQREATEMQMKSEYDKRLDTFLKAYYDYSNNPTELGRREVLGCLAEIKKIKSDFSFDEGKLGKHLRR